MQKSRAFLFCVAVLVLAQPHLWAADVFPLKPDFQINNHAGTAMKQPPNVLPLANGNFLAYWEDQRNASRLQLGQLLDEHLTPIGANFQLAPSSRSDNFYAPLPNGGFISLYWRENSSYYFDIFSPAGISIALNFLNMGTNARHRVTQVLALPNSSFVILEETSETSSSVFYPHFWIFAHNGALLNEIDFQPPAETYFSAPAVTLLNDSTFVLSWVETVGKRQLIYAQLYDFDGRARSVPFKLSESGARLCWLDYYCAALNSNHLACTWFEENGDEPYVLKTCYCTIGDSIATKIIETGAMSNFPLPFGMIKMSSESVFIYWEFPEQETYLSNVYGQTVNLVTGEISGIQRITDEDIDYEEGVSQISFAKWPDNRFVMGWNFSQRDYDLPVDQTVFLQLFDAAGQKIGSNIALNDSTNLVKGDDLAINQNGEIVIPVQQQRIGDTGNYLYASDTFGNLQQKLLLNDDTQSSEQSRPVVAANQFGEYCIVWSERGLLQSRLMTKILNAAGEPLTTDCQIAFWPEEYVYGDAAIAARPDGSFVIVWTETKEISDGGDVTRLWGGKIDRSGSLIGSRFPIDSERNYGNSPDVAVFRNGDFCVTWEDDQRIKARMFHALGGAQTKVFFVVDKDVLEYQFSPAVAINENDQIMFCWVDWRNGTNVYAKLFDKSGNSITPNIRLSNFNGAHVEAQHIYKPEMIFMENGDAISAWIERRDPYDVVCTSQIRVGPMTEGFRLYATGLEAFETVNPIIYNQPALVSLDETNYLLSWIQTTEAGYNILAQKIDSRPLHTIVDTVITQLNIEPIAIANSAALALHQNTLLAVWDDFRTPGKSLDIWASLWDTAQLTRVEWQEPIPQAFYVRQNYPNPFNPATTIEYQIPARQQVEIIVVNTLGQKVQTLQDGEQNAGLHQVLWNGKNELGEDVSSGLYLCRIRCGDMIKHLKMMLLR